MIKDSAYRVKSISTDAVISCVLGGLSVLSMAGAVLASYLYDGKGPAAVGLLGIAGLLMAVVGIIFMVYAWKSVDGGVRMKQAACVLNALPLLAAVLFYFAGWL
ncbi:MAG: hypothetical protein NC300_08030 [Bacteroidales bacterium]|nr:hypothetical protein [Clostridium sp.]MCM1204078.1 hypothetical protein [Bacteroidales bacterium]